MFDDYNWDFDGYCAQQLAGFAELPGDLGLLGPPEGSLVARLKGELVAGLRLIDSLDRSDEFWTGRNRLPTAFKLNEFAQMQLAKPAPTPAFAWYRLAICVHDWSCHLPAEPIWRVERADSIETRWLVEAGYLEWAFWGNDALPMRPVARALERHAEYEAAMNALRATTDPAVHAWIEHERAQPDNRPMKRTKAD